MQNENKTMSLRLNIKYYKTMLIFYFKCKPLSVQLFLDFMRTFFGMISFYPLDNECCIRLIEQVDCELLNNFTIFDLTDLMDFSYPHYQIMRQVKQKSHKNPLIQQFRDKCKEQLKQEAKNYLTNALKDSSFSLDLSQFVPEDLPFFQIVVSLPISKLHIFMAETEAGSPSKSKVALQAVGKLFYQTPRFKDFVRAISSALQENNAIKTLKIQHIPLSVKMIRELSDGIKATKSLRQMSFTYCKLTEEHIESIKTSLSQNQSLITLDLSGNELSDVGGMIGHILSQHSRRRSDMIWVFNLRGEMPVQDISNIGLCEVNLEKNKLNDKAALELASFLKNDGWTKCINLKHNLIHSEGIRQFALMLKSNSSLISLDLRQNQGLTREYSRYIYKKLLLNMEKYKQHKQQIEKNRAMIIQQRSQLQSRVESTMREFNSQDHAQVQFKSLRDQANFESKFENQQYSAIVENKKMQRNNLTIDQKNNPRIPESAQKKENECDRCKQKTFELLRLEKKNLDLELQLRKVRNALLTKNIDISAILPAGQAGQAAQGSLTDLLSGRFNQNDDELLQRMEQIMLELTRVMEGIEEQQQTKENMSNPLDNPNSFSNTINLYPHNSHLHELSKDIEEDRLQSIFEATSSLQHKIDDIG